MMRSFLLNMQPLDYSGINALSKVTGLSQSLIIRTILREAVETNAKNKIGDFAMRALKLEMKARERQSAFDKKNPDSPYNSLN